MRSAALVAAFACAASAQPPTTFPLRTLCAALGYASFSHAFDLVREHKGETFFDGWDFFNFWDNTTTGDVEYISREAAIEADLARTTDTGTTILQLDNVTNVEWNYKRNSIRLESKDWYDFGSVWVFDLKHLPYGCSVWPSIWTYGSDWPNGGEIDIIEGVNLMNANQIALHTSGDCFHSQEYGGTGTLGQANCTDLAGCTVRQTDTRSYGASFQQAGGGVWAVQFDVAGVFIWFWTRVDVPESLKAADQSKLEISSTWGSPVASYPSTPECDMAPRFTKQKLVITTTLCGQWAGLPQVYNATCQTGRNQLGNGNLDAPLAERCYLDNVIGPGSPRYNQAYFEINAIRAYTTGVPAPTTTATSDPTPTPPPPTGGGAASDNIDGVTLLRASAAWALGSAVLAVSIGFMNVWR